MPSNDLNIDLILAIYYERIYFIANHIGSYRVSQNYPNIYFLAKSTTALASNDIQASYFYKISLSYRAWGLCAFGGR